MASLKIHDSPPALISSHHRNDCVDAPVITVLMTPFPTREVILLHGMTGSPEELLSTARFLSEELHARVWLPRLCGHGSFRALKTARAASWLKQITSLVTLIRQSSTAPLSMVGVSFGGILAMYAAQSFPAHLDKIILLAPPWLIKSWWQEILLQTLAILPDVLLDIGIIKKKRRIELVLPRRCFSHHWIGAVVRLVKIRRMIAPSKILAKTLILVDPQEHQVSLEGAQRLAQKLPHARLECIEGGTHELLLGKAYRSVLLTIKDFLQS